MGDTATTPSIQWFGRPIDVVSLGIGDVETLPCTAREALGAADIIIGSHRHFAVIEPLALGARREPYPSPMSKLPEVLGGMTAQKLAVLGSGDALFYGIGRLLIRLVGRDNLRFHPNISSIQACFHALGLDWQDAAVVSLHGRPLSELRRHLEPGALLAVFTDADASPSVIAAELVEQGYGDATVWVCESMGTDGECVRHFDARALAQAQAQAQTVFRVPNVCVLRLRGAGRLPVFPGIPDHHFSTGAEPGFGMISKREVRLAILSFMQPGRGETAWDIGAGCGSVSVEWARWNRTGDIYAVEVDRERVTHLEYNRDRFGVTANCHVVAGEAPTVCDDLPDPDCVFVGGSRGQLESLVDYAWGRLKPGGRLVASAVTDTTRATLAQTWRVFSLQGMECEWAELSVTKSLPGSMQTRRLKPVALLKCSRPVNP